MASIYYERQRRPERHPLLTRAEFIIVLSGAAVLTAILMAAGWFYFHTLDFGP